MAIAYLVTAVLFLIYAVAVWLLAPALRLSGTEALVFRIALLVIGAGVAALVLLMLKRRRDQALPAALQGTAGGLAADVDFIVREANGRLRSSSSVREGGKSVAELPLILVAGETNSTKTTLVLHSGLSPELLSGQAGQDGATVPTRAANIWLASGTVFAEAGGALLHDASVWSRMVQSLAARRLANWLGRGSQAPRAAVVCVDVSQMAGAESAVTAASRRMQERLGEVAQRWGTKLPVYVVFTKCDQVPYFADYLRNFAAGDVEPVFGAALPLNQESGGVYNEAQAARLAAAFDELFFSLADKRAVQLRRENDSTKLPNIYEFPREFRKLRDNVIRYLLDAGRPSQLRTSPFLRGFYFTGVRPIIAESPIGAPAPVQASAGDAGATRIFSAAQAAQAQQVMGARSGARRVPQWVFLKQLFANVILADRAAMGTSGADAQANTMRRILLGTACALLLLWIAGSTVSFFNNRSLLANAESASRSLAGVTGAPGRALSVDELRKLDQLRQAAEEITTYQRTGAPWSFRWGLFGGEPAYEAIRNTYCKDLSRTLLNPVKGSMESTLGSLRVPPQPTDQYDPSFRALKAYLMMTSHREKTDATFLGDTLTARWAADTRAGAAETDLARASFGFYSAERQAGFCNAQPNVDSVETARSHLRGFQAFERIYRSILSDVARKGDPVRFKDPAGSVVDSYEVSYAFTAAGWGQVQKAIRDAMSYLGRDGWVLGDERPANAPAGQELQTQLRQKYQGDFIGQWNTFLNAAAITPYAGLPDAANKLNGFTAPQPPLLRLFCLVSTHTAVQDSPEVMKEFRSFQQLVNPATCSGNPNDAPTAQYMTAMNALAVRVGDIVKTRPPDASIDGSGAKIAARTSAQSLGLPAKAEKLMQDPILQAEALVQKLGPEALNGKGRDFCRETAGVFRRFPFDSRATEDARMEDVAFLLQPNTGKLWQFYQQNLQEMLSSTPSGFVAKSDAKVPVNPAFVSFLNRAAAVSRMLYGANPQRPGFTYNVQPRPSPKVEGYTLTANGKSLSGGESGGGGQDFAWTGAPDTATLALKSVQEPLTGSGVWAIFHVLAGSDRQSEGGTVYEFDLLSRFGRQNQNRAGAAATVKLRVTAPGGAGLLGAFSVPCESRVAR